MSEDLFIDSKLGTPGERFSKHETTGTGLCSSPETSYALVRRKDSPKHVAIIALGFDATVGAVVLEVLPGVEFLS
jgi:hypothetical protein